MGTLEKALLLKDSLELFNEPLLETDMKPDSLFKKMQVAFYKYLFFSICGIFWVLVLLTTMLAHLLKYKSYSLMFLIVLLICMLPNLYILFLFLSAALLSLHPYLPILSHYAAQFVHYSPFISLQHFTLFCLAVPSIVILFFDIQKQKTLYKKKDSQHKLYKQKKFFYKMRHVIGIGKIGKDIFFIILTSLLLSNLILLPLFLFQLNFPTLFALLLLSSIVLLFLFYIISYIAYHKKQNHVGLFPAFVFVIYRFISNALKLASFTAGFIVCTLLLLYLIAFNLSSLRKIKILEPSFSSLTQDE